MNSGDALSPAALTYIADTRVDINRFVILRGIDNTRVCILDKLIIIQLKTQVLHRQACCNEENELLVLQVVTFSTVQSFWQLSRPA